MGLLRICGKICVTTNLHFGVALLEPAAPSPIIMIFITLNDNYSWYFNQGVSRGYETSCAHLHAAQQTCWRPGSLVLCTPPCSPADLPETWFTCPVHTSMQPSRPGSLVQCTPPCSPADLLETWFMCCIILQSW